MTQLFFEDIEAGTEINHEVWEQMATRRLVQWAGAVEDWTEIHYDKDIALAWGFPGVIVHGPLKCALLTRFMNEWIGEHGKLRKISCEYRGMNVPGETLICKGRILKKLVEGGENLVECRIWIENQDGRFSTPAKAIVSLSSKG